MRKAHGDTLWQNLRHGNGRVAPPFARGGVEKESNAMKNPSQSRGWRGDRGWGLPSSGWLRNKPLTLPAIPTMLFGYGLSRGREADVWRTHYAALLHRCLQII